jgi:hypothetical protein
MTVKNFKDSVASQCSWSEYAEELIGDWDMVWENSYADYQGHANILASDGKMFRWIQWDYGSCDYCDAYEGMSHEERQEEFKNELTMEFKDVSVLLNYIEGLYSTQAQHAREIMTALMIYAHVIDVPAKTEFN